MDLKQFKRETNKNLTNNEIITSDAGVGKVHNSLPELKCRDEQFKLSCSNAKMQQAL